MVMLGKKPLLISAFKRQEAVEYANNHHLQADEWIWIPMMNALEREVSIKGRHRYQTWQLIGPFSAEELAYLLS